MGAERGTGAAGRPGQDRGFNLDPIYLDCGRRLVVEDVNMALFCKLIDSPDSVSVLMEGIWVHWNTLVVDQCPSSFWAYRPGQVVHWLWPF